MLITEKDIFDYVFFNDALPEDKREYIRNNITLYSELISLYKEIKPQIDEPLPASIEKKFESILASENRITLYPVNIQKHDDRVTRLAAASLPDKQTFKAVSFTDKDAKYIVRALFFPDKTELFVLSSGDRTLENFTVITKPSLKEYPFKDNKHSILIDEKDIEQVELIYR